MNRYAFFAGLAALLWSGQAAAMSPEEDAYFDLLFGHCFETVLGQPLTAGADDPESWPVTGVEEFSDPSVDLETVDLDVRAKSIGDFSMMVDLANKEVCWTQAGWTADAAAKATLLAARLRIAIADSEYQGVVADQKLEESADGALSLVTIYGLVDYDPTTVPVFVVREPLQPWMATITVQVMKGSKGAAE